MLPCIIFSVFQQTGGTELTGALLSLQDLVALLPFQLGYTKQLPSRFIQKEQFIILRIRNIHKL